MNEDKMKRLIEALKKDLAKADAMWNEKQPHAKIVGWLEGGIRGAIIELEVAVEFINKKK